MSPNFPTPQCKLNIVYLRLYVYIFLINDIKLLNKIYLELRTSLLKKSNPFYRLVSCEFDVIIGFFVIIACDLGENIM